jgi:hypothetical protein
MNLPPTNLDTPKKAGFKLVSRRFFYGNGRCTAHALRRKKNNTEFGYTEQAEAWLTEITDTKSLLQNRGET